MLGLVLVGILVPIALIDLDHRVIPNKITLPAAVAAIVIGLALEPSRSPEQLIAGAAAGGFLLVFALPIRGGWGWATSSSRRCWGCIWGSVAVALLLAVLAGALVGGAIMTRVGVAKGRKTAVPFGPFLAAGGIFALLAGPAIVHWYLHSAV